jgi:PAS domain S-box-containing protein
MRTNGHYHKPTADPLPLLSPADASDHLILELCEPGARGQRGVGLDIGVSRTQRLAAERARDTGELSLSGLIYVTQPQGSESSVALFAPVFNGDPQDPESRRRSLRGWASAGIMITPLMEEVLRVEEKGIAVELVDAFAAQGPVTLYQSPTWKAPARPPTTLCMDVAGRGWELRYALNPAFYQTAGRREPTLMLTAGLSLSLALAALAWALASTRIRALDLAREMTGSLHEAITRNQSHLAYTPLAMIETDENFRVTEWNPAAERIFGYSRSDMLGKDPRMLMPESGQQEVDLRRATLLAAEEGIHLTLEAITSTGERILCDWYNTALRDDQGYFIGASFLADDITERRRTEQAVRQAQKLESLGVLAGGIAHDFNNLLTAILGNTEVAQDRNPGDPILRASLRRIEAATERGADLARQLLAYAGKGHFSVKPLDLNHLIHEMSDLLAISISKKVSLILELQPELPFVEADSAQFQQVVMNLVINASEAIGDNPGTVTLRTQSMTYDRAALANSFPGQVLQPGLFVRLVVSDDGCGMDPETIGRIFDPFFTTKFTGRGLGLSAMLGIVRGHRAGIRVESTPEQGTSFTLLFPATEAVVPPPARRLEKNALQTGTILVVDDEAIIRELAHTALEGAGFQVLEARDGIEALEAIQAGHPVKLVLLDMTMPRMGGAECFRRLKEIAPSVKVLLTSGYTEKESLDSLADLPPNGFLQKPFRVKDLVAKVRELLGDDPSA